MQEYVFTWTFPKHCPGSVTIEYQDEDWIQTIDYEHIPFHCRKFHEHGHLFRDCPLNAQTQTMGEGKSKMASQGHWMEKTTSKEAQSRRKSKYLHKQLF
jgi:hypothetical protein